MRFALALFLCYNVMPYCKIVVGATARDEVKMTPFHRENAPVHILVVEDDIYIGRLIGLALPSLKRPYKFTNVISAGEALDFCAKETYDLLVVDYNLPGMNGLQLVKTLQSRGLHIPTIVCTAYPTTDIERQANALNVDAFIPKPFQIEDLLETINALLPHQDNQDNDEDVDDVDDIDDDA